MVELILFLFICTAVKSIKKQQLVEIRTMANPPAVVKLALESICLLLGENASDWKSIRAVIMRDNFINTVVSNFNTEDIRYACRFRYFLMILFIFCYTLLIIGVYHVFSWHVYTNIFHFHSFRRL